MKSEMILKNITYLSIFSKTGWDYVTHGLIDLAFILINAYTPKLNGTYYYLLVFPFKKYTYGEIANKVY